MDVSGGAPLQTASAGCTTISVRAATERPVDAPGLFSASPRPSSLIALAGHSYSRPRVGIMAEVRLFSWAIYAQAGSATASPPMAQMGAALRPAPAPLGGKCAPTLHPGC